MTSGGDAPGMNATLRSIVRTALSYNMKVIGFRRGYKGVMDGDFLDLDSRSVSNIIQRGGTILHTARCAEFETENGLSRAAHSLYALGVDILFIIGGNGSLRGAHELKRFWLGGIIGLPGTIDNDLAGTDFTIGYDTAINTALDAIDKIRDTADSHERFFLVEVMGRKTGFIAIDVGFAGGAEDVLIPEEPVDIQAVCRRLCAGKERGKTSSIIIVAEGAYQGGAYAVARELKKLSGNEYRVSILGHLQRGGSPTARDRILATKLGGYAVRSAMRGESDVMAGEVRGEMVLTPLEKTWSQNKHIEPLWRETSEVLAM